MVFYVFVVLDVMFDSVWYGKYILRMLMKRKLSFDYNENLISGNKIVKIL